MYCATAVVMFGGRHREIIGISEFVKIINKLCN